MTVGLFFSSGVSLPRNSKIMRFFHDVEMVKQFGSGMNIILRYYGKSIFEIHDDVIMVKAGRAVTTNELLENLVQYKRDAIRRSLNALIELDLVKKTGASVSTVYEINLKPTEQSVSPAIQTFLDLFRNE